MRAATALGILLGHLASELPGQTRHPGAPGSVTVVVDSTLTRPGLIRWLLGSNYREVWARPIQAEVLDIERFAGGLTPLETGGGMQTRSLRFRGADGRDYQFRLMRKDPKVEDSTTDGRLVRAIVRDQISANHPGAGFVIPDLLHSIDVLHAPPRLWYLPDHPRLGEFGPEFGNQVGTIEVRPTDRDDTSPGFGGAARIENTEGLLKALQKKPWIQVDSRRFLALRLVDLVAGDWDRHEGQYRWALMEDEQGAAWEPIPRDWDQAFARFEGVLLGLTRRWIAPKLLVYREDYPSPEAATSNGRHLDRRLLNDLEWSVWDSVTTAVQQALTDEVIDRAVSRLPPGYEVPTGGTLRRILKARRDHLPEASRRYYKHVTRQVLIHGGDEDDWTDILRLSDGRTRVSVGRRGEARPYYQRTFDPREVAEIRVFLHDGADAARIHGDGKGSLVRVIGGGGADTLRDESVQRQVRFYDSGEATVADGRSVDRRPYLAAADTNPEILPPEDWGSRRVVLPRVSHSSFSGLALGIGLNRLGYGFRREPYASLHTASLDYSFERNALRAIGELRWRRVNRQTYYGIRAMASGMEGGRFYGFGNEAPDTLRSARSLVLREDIEVAPYLGFGLETHRRLWLGLQARHVQTETDLTRGGDAPPLGAPAAGHFGPAARFELDTRDTRFAPSSGIYLQLRANYAPVTWSSESGAFGAVEGAFATYLTPRNSEHVTLAMRVGGRRVWGDYPYFEAAYIGGNRTLRGYHRDRFAGDQSVYGNSELRVKVGENRLIVPVEIGILGMADGGRVWVDGASPGTWHTGIGAGIWMTALGRSRGFATGVAKSDEGWRAWFSLGAPLYRPVVQRMIRSSP